MKKIIRLVSFNFLLILLAVNFSSAQTHVLYGTCNAGGTYNRGTIFRANMDGSNLHMVYAFHNPEGAAPWGKTVQAPNGKIYGVTYLGGCQDSCTLYEYDPVAGECIDVYDFYCNSPASEPSPYGPIILSDGNIYGLEQNGIIYKFDPNTHVYTLLHMAGGSCYGGLMQASNGKLYGVVSGSGAHLSGFIFSYDLAAQAYSIVYIFDGIHGSDPNREILIQAPNGKLYGTTYNGGANGKGVVFSYDIVANVYSDLFDFDVAHGSLPQGGLMLATNGKLYGMTYEGGTFNYGVIYSYDIFTSQYSVLYNFDGTNGSHPYGSLTQASNGKLFGTARLGGADSSGVAFRYDIATSVYTKLKDFEIITGAYPQSDFQEAILPDPEGIASANNSSASIYVHASNQLVVRSPRLGDKNEIVIYDALGKNVFQSEIRNQNSEFNLFAYPSGIYFVQLKTNQELFTQKIILAR